MVLDSLSGFNLCCIFMGKNAHVCQWKKTPERGMPPETPKE